MSDDTKMKTEVKVALIGALAVIIVAIIGLIRLDPPPPPIPPVPPPDVQTLTIPIPGTKRIYGGDLVIDVSEGSTAYRVSIVISSTRDGQLGGWTLSRKNELAQTSKENFRYVGKKFSLYVMALPSDPQGNVKIVIQPIS